MTIPPPNNLPTTSENYNAQSPLDESDRPYFTHDVNPVQKKAFNSDQFNQKQPKKTNGYICHIQGIKAQGSKASVLPRIAVSHPLNTSE